MFYGGEVFGTASKAGKVAELGILGTPRRREGRREGLTSASRTPRRRWPREAAEHAPGLLRKMVASGAGSAVEGMRSSRLRARSRRRRSAITTRRRRRSSMVAARRAASGSSGRSAGRSKTASRAPSPGSLPSRRRPRAREGGGKSAIGKMADDQAFRSIASNNASLKIAEKDARAVGGATGVGETLNELGLVRKFREAPADYAERLGGGEERVGREDRRSSGRSSTSSIQKASIARPSSRGSIRT
jgi:hypothetical protein